MLRTNMAKRRIPRRPFGTPEQASAYAGSFLAAAKASCMLIAAGLVLWHSRSITDWLESIQHVKYGQLELDRGAVERALNTLAVQGKDTGLLRWLTDDKKDALVTLGHNLAPALNGARILWVDPNPDHNVLEASLFMLYGIQIQRAFSTDDAFKFLETAGDHQYDLIVTNSWRQGEDHKLFPLQECPVVFSELRQYDKKPTPENPAPQDLPGYNRWMNEQPLAAFALAEKLRPKYKDIPLILYSGETGSIVGSRCFIGTNITFVFIREVFLALAARRWQQLQPQRRPSTADISKHVSTDTETGQ